LKGIVELDFAYTRKQNNQVEGGCDWFDIRRLPKKYRNGIDIAPSFSSAFADTSNGHGATRMDDHV
jgi:hypothetical protein